MATAKTAKGPSRRRVGIVPDELRGRKLDVFDFRDPGTNQVRSYAFFDGDGGETQVLEANWFRPKNASWFVGEDVISDGGILLYSKVNPAFFLLPPLRECKETAGVFCTAEHLVDAVVGPSGCSDVPGGLRGLLEKSLGDVCEEKRVGEESFYRYSEEKAVGWLKERTGLLKDKVRGLGAQFKALDEEGLTRYSVSYLGEYLPQSLVSKLEASFDLPCVSAHQAPPMRQSPPASADAGGDPSRSSAKRPKPSAKISLPKKASKVAKADTGSMKISSFFQRRS